MNSRKKCVSIKYNFCIKYNLTLSPEIERHTKKYKQFDGIIKFYIKAKLLNSALFSFSLKA